jgi:hypothetical protein
MNAPGTGVGIRLYWSQQGEMVEISIGSKLHKKVVVGAIIDRPQILSKQNLSPQGENTLIFLRKI